MKKSSLLVLTFLAATAFTTLSYGQGAMQSPAATAEGKNVTVKYAQPSKRGREIFGGLVPYGKVWRTGANAATEITFAKDGKFGGKDVKAGTYTLYTIPTEKEWTVILNSQTGQWGTEYSEAKDVTRVKVPSKKAPQASEKFTIKVDDAASALVMMWDETMVSVPVKF